MEEVKRFVQECLPTLTTEDIYLIMETFFYLGVESFEDLQFIEPEKDLSSVLKLVQARKLKMKIDARFSHQQQQDKSTNGAVVPSYEQSSTPIRRMPSNGAVVSYEQSSTPIRQIMAQPTVAEIIRPSPSSSNRQAIESIVKPNLDSESLLEKIPYHKFSKQLLFKLERGEIPTPSERREVVRIIVAAVMDYIPSPRKSHLEAVAMEVVRRYPESFKDTIGEDSIGLGHGSLLCQFIARAENCRRIVLGGKNRKSSLELQKMPKRFSDSYGCVNHQPNDFPEGEDMETQKEKLLVLKSEFSKINRNNQLINRYMQETYFSQRTRINSKLSMEVILNEWPFLKERNYFYQHAEILLGFSLKEKLDKNLQEKLEGLMDYVKNLDKRKNFFQYLFHFQNQLPHLFMLKILASLFDEDLEILLKIYESDTSIEDIIDEAPLSPFIACIGDPNETDSVCTVFVEREPLETNVPMEDAFLMWFAAFYVFNLLYPKECCATLEFIQRAIFGMNPLTKGSKMGKRYGKRVDIHPKVMNLITKLKSLASQNT